MWRKFFGPEARIIGVDLNPGAKKWEAEGFEIHIGSQSDEGFWKKFFETVGDVDLVLDDGGHTNEQQIVTAHMCIPHIRDKGLLLVEDVHASYMKSFANPSPYSFINYTKSLMDSINSRFPEVKVSRHPFGKLVYAISVYESIVGFHVDRSKCFVSTETSNNGIPMAAQDFRNTRSGWVKSLEDRLAFMKTVPLVRTIGKWLLNASAHKQVRQYF
jgi:hypothetical protein